MIKILLIFSTIHLIKPMKYINHNKIISHQIKHKITRFKYKEILKAISIVYKIEIAVNLLNLDSNKINSKNLLNKNRKRKRKSEKVWKYNYRI